MRTGQLFAFNKRADLLCISSRVRDGSTLVVGGSAELDVKDGFELILEAFADAADELNVSGVIRLICTDKCRAFERRVERLSVELFLASNVSDTDGTE